MIKHVNSSRLDNPIRSIRDSILPGDPSKTDRYTVKGNLKWASWDLFLCNRSSGRVLDASVAVRIIGKCIKKIYTWIIKINVLPRSVWFCGYAPARFDMSAHWKPNYHLQKISIFVNTWENSSPCVVCAVSVVTGLPSGLCLRFETVQTRANTIQVRSDLIFFLNSKHCNAIKHLTKFGLDFAHAPACSLDQVKFITSDPSVENKWDI